MRTSRLANLVALISWCVLNMDYSSNHSVGQEVDEGLLVGGIPKESFLGHRQAHFFGDRHHCANVVAWSTSTGFILCTGAVVSIKNYSGIGLTSTHMSYVRSAYFSIFGILWPSELVKQPFNKQALIYLLADKMVRAGIHKKSNSCRCWRLLCFPVPSSPRRSRYL